MLRRQEKENGFLYHSRTKEGFTVVGLTTSACLWISAAIGMASGAGLYGIASGTTILALFSLTLLRRIERRFRRDTYRNLLVAVTNDANIRRIIEEVKSKEISPQIPPGLEIAILTEWPLRCEDSFLGKIVDLYLKYEIIIS